MMIIESNWHKKNRARPAVLLHIGCICLFLLLLLSSCTKVGPDFSKPETPLVQEWSKIDGVQQTDINANIEQWWQSFNDPTLTTIVKYAYNQNLNLQVAGLRILQARAHLGIALGSLYPQQQQINADLSSNRISENNGVPVIDNSNEALRVGFDAAWELDFWGKYRRSIESGVAQLKAAIAGYDNMLVSVTAEAARLYISIRTLEKRLKISKENVAIQKEILTLVLARFNGGEVSKLDVTQARYLLYNTQALVPRLQSGRHQAKNGLAILLGMLPDQIDLLLNQQGDIPLVSDTVLVEMPAELLRRRPDIRLAELRIAAQSPQVGVARADLFPHLSLFGSIGWQATQSSSTDSSISDIFSSKSIYWRVGPTFSWDIFNYARIKNKVRAEDAKLQEVVVHYRNTVITAQNEVESSMAAFAYSRREKEFLADSVTNAREAAYLSMLQYEDGQIDFQRVLDSQRFLSSQADNLAMVKGRVSINLVALYKTMGGGWQIRNGKRFLNEKTQKQMSSRTDWGELLDSDELILWPPTPSDNE